MSDGKEIDQLAGDLCNMMAEDFSAETPTYFKSVAKNLIELGYRKSSPENGMPKQEAFNIQKRYLDERPKEFDEIMQRLGYRKSYPENGMEEFNEYNVHHALHGNALNGGDVSFQGVARMLCKKFSPPPRKVMTRTDIAFMIQEIVHEAHKRPEGSDMGDLIDKYSQRFTVTMEDISELEGLLVCIMQILDGPEDMPMSEWYKEQRIKLGQWAERLHGMATRLPSR